MATADHVCAGWSLVIEDSRESGCAIGVRSYSADWLHAMTPVSTIVVFVANF